MRAIPFVSLLVAPILCLSPALRADSTHAIGLGAHYWRVIDDIEVDDVDEAGVSYLAAYRYDGGILALQAELEVFPEEFGGAGETVYSPQALLIVGDGVYAGIGAGVLYSDGEFADAPFYLLRAGIALAAFGPLTLDLNANYVFTDFDNLGSDDISSDTITLGAMLRVEL